MHAGTAATPMATPSTPHLLSAKRTTEASEGVRGNQSMRQDIQKLLNELLLRCAGQSYLNTYVPMPPCAATLLIHIAEPSLISQCKNALNTAKHTLP